MKPHAAALFVVRAIGLAVVVWRLPGLCGGIATIIREGFIDWLSRVTFMSGQSGYFLAEFGLLLQFGVGLYMLFGGKRLARILLRGLPGVPGLCERCGYDISGIESSRCPECGARLADRQ